MNDIIAIVHQDFPQQPVSMEEIEADIENQALIEFPEIPVNQCSGPVNWIKKKDIQFGKRGAFIAGAQWLLSRLPSPQGERSVKDEL